ncbi:MFS transporter [Celeribacter baekdonensis]|uniref:MFS transporter n=1 Tax=Celeribacter baekdonensis TaxID=875171 RepID=UPI0030DC58B3|tara:strand:+ start:272628 stop:273899 length:1272 start_codon:yes stop_codon:yes gene_type:complete
MENAKLSKTSEPNLVAADGKHSRHAIIALSIAAVFFLFEFVTRVSPSTATETISADLGLSRAGLGVFSSLFFWIYAPMQIGVGLLLDRYGARRFVVPAIALCAGGMMLIGVAPSAFVAALGRILTGFGASFAFVGALYVVNHWFAPKRFALLSGLVNAVGMLGTAVGVIWLTSLVQSAGWRPSFIGIGVFGLALSVIALFAFRDAPSAGDSDTHPSPIGPLKQVIKSPQVWLVACVGALVYMPINVYGGLWGNEELTADHGLSSVAAETAVSMVFWGMALGSVLWGAVSDALGHRKWIVFGCAILAMLAWSVVIFLPLTQLWIVSVLLFLGGLFCGGQMLTFAMAKEGQDQSTVGTVTAFVNMIGIGAALVFQPLVGVLLDLTDNDHALALSVVPLCLVLAAGLTVVLREPDQPHLRAKRRAK